MAHPITATVSKIGGASAGSPRTAADRRCYLAGLFDDECPGHAHFGILTTGPNRLMAPVHDRMPALFSPEEAVAWLAEPSQKLLHWDTEELLVAMPVSLRVNSVRNDDPDCLAPPAASRRDPSSR